MALKRNRRTEKTDSQSAGGQVRWDEHSHEPIVHSHRHSHVTHHRRSLTGTFEHLVSEHDHEHDHAGLTHSHAAHQNVVAEHQDEAHVHDHGQAIKPERAAGATTPKKPAPKKAAPKRGTTAKKATKRSR